MRRLHVILDEALDLAIAASIDTPHSDARLVSACEAIVAARDAIDRAAARRPAEADARAVILRRKSARLLFERIRGGKAAR